MMTVGRMQLILLCLCRAWWYITVLSAAWTGLMKPYVIAFEAHPGQRCGSPCQCSCNTFALGRLTFLTFCPLLQAIHRHCRSD